MYIMARSKYEVLDIETRLPEIEQYARDGWTDEMIFKKIGVAKQTFYTWKTKYPEFAEALRKGKEVVDSEIENELLESARGRVYWEETQVLMKVVDEETGLPVDKMVTVKRVLKRDTPSVTAQIFWLKNRNPGKWRDKQITEHTGAIGVQKLDYMDDDELDAAINKIKGEFKK